MNKPLRYSSAVALALASLAGPRTYAQDETDALRFSMLQPQGTARSMGFGSALGSIGGEYSSLSVNPAGIGVYRRGELTFSPSMVFGGSTGNYSGTSTTDNGAHFAISNIGIVSAKARTGRRAAKSGWTTSGFAFGLTRMADFTRNYSYGGENRSSSASYVFENDANQNGVSQPGEAYTVGDLGYKSFLLDVDSFGYISNVFPNDNQPISQGIVVKERGGISELGLTFGGSYKDKLMLGGSLGIPFLRYRRNKSISEYDISGNTNNNFDNFQYSDELRTSGAGVNIKLGAIYKPNDILRFGASIHTPTWFSLTDVYNMSLTANTENYGIANNNGRTTETVQAAENQYDYNLSTPWRAVASATVMFGTAGFWSVDYEYVNYASARFGFGPSSSEQQYERALNDVIKTYYRGASNIRTGVEFRLDNFFLRGGFGYYGNPYKDGTYGNRTLPGAQRLDFSGGVGMRFENTFIDFAFVHRRWSDNEQPYSLPNEAPYLGIVVPTATIKSTQNNAVLTFGVKF